MAFDDLARRMKDRRDQLPGLEPGGIAPEWLMGIGILLVIVGVLLIAVHMGPSTESGIYRPGGGLVAAGVVGILRGMFRTRG